MKSVPLRGSAVQQPDCQGGLLSVGRRLALVQALLDSRATAPNYCTELPRCGIDFNSCSRLFLKNPLINNVKNLRVTRRRAR